jgi:DNA-binding transcriptional LysR family regulator
MEMQQVRYFLAVARTLNFTRAAEECHVTQPALTRAIKQLEDEFGGELIRREGRNSHLTDLGNRMQPMLRQCYDSAVSAKALATRIKQGEIPTLSLAVSQTLELDLLLASLEELRRAFPGLKLKLRRGTGPEISTLLKDGEVELAIGGPVGENWDRLEVWPMFNEAFDLIVGSTHSLAGHNALELDVELIREERFLIHAGTYPVEFEAAKLDRAGIDLQRAHEVDSSRDVEALVVAEYGVALMPASTLNSAKVKHLRLSALDLRRTVAIYSAAGRPRSREAAAFLNLVRSADWTRQSSPELLDGA